MNHSTYDYFKSEHKNQKKFLKPEAENGYPLAKVAMESINAYEVLNTPNLLIEEIIDRLTPAVTIRFGEIYELEFYDVQLDAVKDNAYYTEKYYKITKNNGYEDSKFWFWKNYEVAMRRVLATDVVMAQTNACSIRQKRVAILFEKEFLLML